MVNVHVNITKYSIFLEDYKHKLEMTKIIKLLNATCTNDATNVEYMFTHCKVGILVLLPFYHVQLKYQ